MEGGQKLEKFADVNYESPFYISFCLLVFAKKKRKAGDRIIPQCIPCLCRLYTISKPISEEFERNLIANAVTH